MKSPNKKEINAFEQLEKLIERTVFNEEKYEAVKSCISRLVKGEKSQKTLKEVFFKYLYDIYIEILSIIAFDYDRFKKEAKQPNPNSQKQEILHTQLEERNIFLHQVANRLEKLALME